MTTAGVFDRVVNTSNSFERRPFFVATGEIRPEIGGGGTFSLFVDVECELEMLMKLSVREFDRRSD